MAALVMGNVVVQRRNRRSLERRLARSAVRPARCPDPIYGTELPAGAPASVSELSRLRPRKTLPAMWTSLLPLSTNVRLPQSSLVRVTLPKVAARSNALLEHE